MNQRWKLGAFPVVKGDYLWGANSETGHCAGFFIGYVIKHGFRVNLQRRIGISFAHREIN